MRALLVVGSPATRDSLASVLAGRGHDAVCAAGHAEAAAICAASPVQLAICDWPPADHSGGTLCTDLHRQGALLMAVLPSVSPDALASMAEAGIDDWLVATASPAELAARLTVAERRIATEEALRASEQSHRELLDGALDPVYTLDLEGSVTYLNRAAEALLGYSCEEATGLRLDQIAAPGHVEMAREAIAAKLAGEPATKYEIEVVSRDGSHIALEVSTRLILRDGRPTGIQGIARDITARRHASEQLGFQAYLLDQVDAAVVVTAAPNREIIYWNRRAEELFGWPRGEAIGVSANDLPLHEIIEEREVETRAALNAGRAWAGYFTGIRKDGTRFPGQVTINPVCDTEGRRIGAATVILDCTERQLAAEAVARRERDFRALFERNPDPMWVYDPETLAFLAVNDAAIENYGFSREEFLGMRITGIRPEEDVPALLERLRTPRSGSNRAENRHRRKDGSLLWAAIHGEDIEFEGRAARLMVAHDITARREAEQAISWLAAVVESSSDAILTVDLERTVLSWNPGCERIYGWTASEAVGCSLPEIVVAAPEERWVQDDVLARVLAGEAIPDYEARRTGKDGRLVDVSVSSFPLKNGEGRIVAVAGIHRDIGERKRAENALRASEERLRGYLEQSSDLIFTLRPDGTLGMANEAACRILGYTAEELAGKSPLDLVPPEHAEAVRSSVGRLFAGEPVSRTELEIITASGGRMWLEVLGHQIVQDGKVAETFHSARDITARKRAEEALRASEERLRNYLQGANDLVFAVDASFRLTMANDSVCRTTGYSEEELLGRNFAELVAPGSLGPAAEAMVAIYGGHTIDSLEVEIITKGGRSIWLEVRGRAFSTGGRVTETLHIARDVTERRLMEAAQRESEANFRAVAETAPAAIFVLGAGGFLFVNEALCQVTGYGREEVFAAPDPIALIMHPEMRDLADATRAARLSGMPAPSRYETRLITRSGEERWMDLSATAVTFQGQAAILGIALDVTESKRNQEERARLAAVVESSSDAIVVRDLEGRTVVWNSGAERMYGYSAAETLGQTSALLATPGSETESADLFRRALGGEAPQNVETVRLHKDGTPVVASLSLFPIRGADGAITAVGGIARDLTAQRLSEEALRTTQRYLRTIVENAPVILIAVDTEGTFTFTDGAGLALLGREPGESVGLSFFELYAAYPEATAAMRRALAGERSSIDLEIGGFWWTAHYVPIPGDDGRPRGAIGFVVDMTAARAAEEARRLAEERLRAVASNAPIVLWAIDEVGTFTLSEGQGLDPLGLGPGGLVGESIFATFAASPNLLENVRRGLAGEPFNIVEEVLDAWWEVRAVPTGSAEGNVRGLAGVAIDVTERRRAEDALLQAQKLESLGVLAGGIAHDFNNLLVGILGNAGLARMELSPESPARETIADIELAAQRAAELSRQMLAYSGKGQFVVQRLDLTHLVEEMTHLLRVSIGKTVTLKYDFATSLPAVEADATQLRQVVMNLVINASDAIGEHEGVIHVSTGLRHADRACLEATHFGGQLPEGDYLFLEVADSGSGMDAETRARIFDPFFTTKFTGRGLGLAAVLGIVRGHHGAIRVDSEPGKGTNFTVLLPAADAPAAPAPAAGTAAASAKGLSGTALVVDDEPSVRAVTARALESMGLRVLTAADGLEGVELFREHAHEIDCVLLDMTMPRMGGEAAFAEMHRIRPGARVIILSGYSESDATRPFAGQALSGFIQKPFDLVTLREAVKQALR